MQVAQFGDGFVGNVAVGTCIRLRNEWCLIDKMVNNVSFLWFLKFSSLVLSVVLV